MTPPAALLLSGGLDSAAAACLDSGSEFVFVDYGQPLAARERASAEYVAAALVRRLVVVDLRGSGLASPDDPEETVPGRNLALARAAAEATGAAVVVLGARCVHEWFDRHGDCSPQWARRASAEIGAKVTSPLRGWPKWLVLATLRACRIDRRRLTPTNNSMRGERR